MKKLVAFALILSLGMFSVVGCGGPAPVKKDGKDGKGVPAAKDVKGGAPEKGAPAK